MAYEKIKQEIKAIQLSEYGEEAVRRQLDIGFEWSVLIEAQHIVDELQMMQEVFTQQLVVVKDLEKAIKSMGDGYASSLARATQLILDIELRRGELIELEKHQDKTRAQVSTNTSHDNESRVLIGKFSCESCSTSSNSNLESSRQGQPWTVQPRPFSRGDLLSCSPSLPSSS